MTGARGPKEDAALRRLAEEALALRGVSREDREAPAAEQSALHELRVHQIQLEMQADELRRAHIELEASRARYFELYDLAPVGYVTLSEAGLILTVNLTFATLIGTSRGSLLKVPFSQCLDVEDLDLHYVQSRRAFVTGVASIYEVRMRRVAAPPFWARLEAIAAREDGGTPILRVVVSDISAKRRAEDDLRRAATEYRALAEHLPDWLARFDTELRYLYLNPAAVRAGALSGDEYVGKTMAEAGASAQIVSAWEPRLRAALSTASPLELEAEIRAPAGLRWLLTSFVPEIGVDGNVVSLLAIAHDLTDRRRDQLEKDRIRAALAQSDRLASMGLLAGGMAHEVNNPLAYTVDSLETLAEDLPRAAGAANRCCAALWAQVGDSVFAAIARDGAELLEPASLRELGDRAEAALDGARRIQEISRTLSTFSRVEHARLGEVQVGRAIEHAVRMVRAEIKYRARLAMDLGPVPPVWASEGKLAQVFLNLLLNAAQAVGEGGAEHNSITIRAWAEGGSVFAEVGNTGQEIPPEDLERIFDPFFTTKKVGEGSGLGLAVCRSLVGELGGEIRVESRAGEGTRFVVRLPAAPIGVSAPKAEVQPAKPAGVARRGRVLVVDDEPGIRAILRRLLQAAHDVVEVASGAEARELLGADRAFDVILCDLMMPGMSGAEVHAWLAAQDAAAARRVVFVSGGAFLPGVAEYVEGSGNVLLEKPIDAARLRATVAELVAAAPVAG